MTQGQVLAKGKRRNKKRNEKLNPCIRKIILKLVNMLKVNLISRGSQQE